MTFKCWLYFVYVHFESNQSGKGIVTSLPSSHLPVFLFLELFFTYILMRVIKGEQLYLCFQKFCISTIFLLASHYLQMISYPWMGVCVFTIILSGIHKPIAIIMLVCSLQAYLWTMTDIAHSHVPILHRKVMFVILYKKEYIWLCSNNSPDKGV